MQTGSTAGNQFAALDHGMFQPDQGHFGRIGFHFGQGFNQPGRNNSPAHFGKLFDLAEIGDWHDTGNDPAMDTGTGCAIDKPEVFIIIEKQLSNDKIATLVHLPFQIFDIGFR